MKWKDKPKQKKNKFPFAIFISLHDFVVFIPHISIKGYLIHIVVLAIAKDNFSFGFFVYLLGVVFLPLFSFYIFSDLKEISQELKTKSR